MDSSSKMDYQSDSKLVELVKQSKNKELQSFLEGTNNPSDGTTLLHLAVIQNNIALIKYWLDAGYDIDAKNSAGDTALLLALKSNNFLAVKMLVDGNSDVCITDASTDKNTLEILMQSPKNIIDDILPHFVKNFHRRNVDVLRLFEPVIATECDFEHILLMSNALITRKYLALHPKCNVDCWSTMKLAMERRDIGNVQVLLHYNGLNGMLAFYGALNHFFRKKQIALWQVFIKRLSNINVNVIGKQALEPLNRLYKATTLEYLQILLDCKIDVLVKKRFGIDLRTAIFVNKNVDAIELLRGRDFNVNSPGIGQTTALLYAIDGHVKSVQFLLESSAKIDVRNHLGRTPLFNCILHNRIESSKLLLEYGANVQIVDDQGRTIFHLAESKNSALLMLEYLIARLALDHTQSVPIIQSIQSKIRSNVEYKIIYETCCQQLQRLKTHEIVEFITLYDLLTGKVEALSRFLFNRDIIPLLDQYNEQHVLHPLYYNTMKSKLIKISNLFIFYCGMADVISKDTGILIDFYHLILRNISQYLTYDEVSEFIKYSQSIDLNK